jgi:hypothetical protein
MKQDIAHGERADEAIAFCEIEPFHLAGNGKGFGGGDAALDRLEISVKRLF